MKANKNSFNRKFVANGNNIEKLSGDFNEVRNKKIYR